MSTSHPSRDAGNGRATSNGQPSLAGGKCRLTEEQRALVGRAMHLVGAIAKRIRSKFPRMEHDELVALGNEVLSRAALDVDLAHQEGKDELENFECFAAERIQGHMVNAAIREIRDRARYLPLRGAEWQDDDGAEVGVGCSYVNPEALLNSAQVHELVRVVESALADNEKRIVDLRFRRGDTQPTAAAAMGLSLSTFRRRENVLLEKMRKRLKEVGVTEAWVIQLAA